MIGSNIKCNNNNNKKMSIPKFVKITINISSSND